MTTSYSVKIRNRVGVRQYEFGDFFSLTYNKVLNGWGLLNIQVPNNHASIAKLEEDGQIEVWRFDNNAGIEPYCDFFGLYRDRDRATPANTKNGIFTIKCVEQKQYMWRAVTGHPAGTANRNDFTSVAGETVMKNLVKYNATADASTDDGRKRVPTWASLITVAADTTAGNPITKAFAHRKLDDCLQECAVLAGLDWDLVKTGARSWEFRTGNWGSDLSDEIKFSLAWDNLGNPRLVGNAIKEETVAMVWGQDTGGDRAFLEVHGPNYHDDYNDIETFVNAANQASGGLQAAGDARMNDVRSRDDLRGEALQSGPYRYGRDYCANGVLGDIVGFTYYESMIPKRIRGVQVAVQTSSGGQNAEQIQLDMATVVT